MCLSSVFILHKLPRSRNSSEVALSGFIWVAGALSSTLLSVLGEFLLPLRSDEVVDIVALDDFFISGYEVGHTLQL